MLIKKLNFTFSNLFKYILALYKLTWMIFVCVIWSLCSQVKGKGNEVSLVAKTNNQLGWLRKRQEAYKPLQIYHSMHGHPVQGGQSMNANFKNSICYSKSL